MYNHQDWETVVLKKTKRTEIQKDRVKHDVPISSTTNKPIWKIEQQIDNEGGAGIKRVSKEDAQKIILGRVAMKLSQKELANKLNMQVKEIQEVESSKAFENKSILSKIRRTLSII